MTRPLPHPANLLPELRAFPLRYPVPRLLGDRSNREHSAAEALSLVVDAARRMLVEHRDHGITVGAEEDAELAIYVVSTLVPSAEVKAARAVYGAAYLARALDAIRSDDGIGAGEAEDLRRIVVRAVLGTLDPDCAKLGCYLTRTDDVGVFCEDVGCWLATSSSARGAR